MIRPLIGTSWKMHFTSTEARAYLDTLLPLVAGQVMDRDVFVLPPFTSIWVAREVLNGSGVTWGAQDVTALSDGSHTGGISARMLADLGCTFVEVGHAERRRDDHETDEDVAAKVVAVAEAGMVPILCVGEADYCRPEEAIRTAVSQAVAGVNGARSMPSLVVAYEPAWAIGHGKRPADSRRIMAVCGQIRSSLEVLLDPAAQLRIIYGGNVDETAAGTILSAPHVDGLFVGHAALDPRRFATIAGTPLDRRDTEGSYASLPTV
jgi:triosephosphate isomerase